MRTAAAAVRRLHQLRDPERATFLQRYFRTGKGEYAVGDRFLGLTVPMVRALCPKCDAMPMAQVIALLKSPWHEARLLALLVLVRRFERGDAALRREVYRAYLRHTRWINNWDLVDVSAPRIVGAHLLGRDPVQLDRWARSTLLWERRIAMLATSAFIGAGDVGPTLRIALRLLDDSHDLIHKAAGWMLREAAKRDPAATRQFLRAHQHRMPRTMLRYAIERFPAVTRRRYLAGTA